MTFKVSRGTFARKQPLRALQNVDLAVSRGETLAIVGESGSGKTTLALTMLNLAAPTSGTVEFEGRPVAEIGRKAFARRVQPVFQDPYSSLNPHRTIADAIIQPLAIHGIGDRPSRTSRVRELLDLVGLPQRTVDLYPDSLSGGQRQRVALARALATKPDVLICDEPTSALDVSVQAQILNLLEDLRTELNLTYVLITHNLAVVEHMASRVAVMYLGRIVEEATVSSLFSAPRHPYSSALLESVLTPDPELGLPKLGLGNTFPNPLHPPSGCSFHPRCIHAFGPCSTRTPRRATMQGSTVECHLHDPAVAGLPTVSRSVRFSISNHNHSRT